MRNMGTTSLYDGGMTTTHYTDSTPAADLMDFDLRCARQGIEAAAQSIASLAAQLVTMAQEAQDPFDLAHYAKVISSDALMLRGMAEYAKGIAAAKSRLGGLSGGL